MTSLKSKKFISILLVLAMALTLLPATVVLGASYKSVEDFVTNLYVAGLGRQPEEAGLKFWLDELEKGRPAAEVIGFVLLDSEEFNEKFADIPAKEFVKKAYEIVFAREAEEGGLEFWVDEMRKGASQRYVIVSMLQAPTGEFQEFCEEFGIKVGTLPVRAEERPGEEYVDKVAPEFNYKGETKFTVEFGEEFTLPVVTATDNIDGEVDVTRVITNKAGEKIAKIDTTVPGVYTITYSAVDVAGNVKELVLTVTVEPFRVVEVSAINATQVVVKFSAQVDKDDAETVTKYSIDGVNPDSAELQADGKTVKLTFANASEVEVTEGVLIVNPVKTKADPTKMTAKYTQVFTYKDTVKPEIVSVESKTSGDVATSVTVKASEPISYAIVKIDGVYVGINFNGTDTAVITGLNLDASKSHTLEVINLTDKATTPNVTALITKTFNIIKDTTAPTVTLSTRGEKEILLTFNKPMDAQTVRAAFPEGTTTSSPVKDELLNPVTTNVATVVPDTNDTQFVIEVTQSLFENKDTRTLAVAFPDTITDKLGNKMASTVKSVTLTKDTTKPVPVDYKIVKNANGEVTAIEIYFSEGLAAGTPADPTIIVDENGVDVTNSFLGGLTAGAITAGDKKVTYNATSAAKISGKYVFSFPAGLVSDLAETPNKSDAFNYTFDFGKAEEDTTFELTDIDSTTTANVITITFPEAVKGGAVAGSATDPANYTLAGKPLPAGTTIVFTDGTQTEVKITLPDESIEKDDGYAVFTVANIKNLAGTKTLKTYTGTVAVKDNVKPVLVSAKAIDDVTIDLTFSEEMENISSPVDVKDEFIIKEGNVAKTFDGIIASSVSGYPKKIRLTLRGDTLDLTKDLTITTKSVAAPGTPVIKDASFTGNPMKANVTVTITKNN